MHQNELILKPFLYKMWKGHIIHFIIKIIVQLYVRVGYATPWGAHHPQPYNGVGWAGSINQNVGGSINSAHYLWLLATIKQLIIAHTVSIMYLYTAQLIDCVKWSQLCLRLLIEKRWINCTVHFILLYDKQVNKLYKIKTYLCGCSSAVVNYDNVIAAEIKTSGYI